ncbi:MAG: helix-turn-helix domain-containing protein, partial [Burkholderiaceae bacterium]|nr:helix-turn-helix domain-containing protein [Burkholderiaceae bacterium]
RKLEISQGEIGYLTGLSRQRVNQALRRLEGIGLLKVDYGGVTVLSVDGLREFED